MATGAGVEWRPVGIAPKPSRVRGLLGLVFGAETRIKDAQRLEFAVGASLVGGMWPLPAHRRFERDAEPGKVIEGCGFIFRFTARAIQVFQAQQQTAARSPRSVRVQECGISVTEMQTTIRSRREPVDRALCFGHQRLAAEKRSK